MIPRAENLNLVFYSMPIGGVSLAASSSDISERNIKRHGRWKKSVSKDGYIADSLQSRLNVTRAFIYFFYFF